MITMKIRGGVGNQLFQYAATRALAQRLDVTYQFDITALSGGLRSFALGQLGDDVPLVSLSGWHSTMLGVRENFLNFPRSKKYFIDQEKGFDPTLWNVNRTAFLSGYFQSYKYFETISDELISSVFAVPRISDNVDLARQDHKRFKTAVHIRRGDYLLQSNSAFHGILARQYYLAACEELGVDLFDPSTLIFTDSAEHVSAEFGINPKQIFANNYLLTDLEIIALMSLFPNIVISNSTFSWWSAWLGQSKGQRIIAPNKWFANSSAIDLIPAKWALV